MHGGDAVHERPEGVVHVVRPARLVVDRVEGGDQVVAVLLSEVRDVPDLEADVNCAMLGGLGAGDGLLGEVVAREAAVRELAGREVEGATAAAPDVQNVDTLLRAFGQARHEGQDAEGLSRPYSSECVEGAFLEICPKSRNRHPFG